MWIDTHCHLDAPEFACDVDAVRKQARRAGVARGVLPAVRGAEFPRARELACRFDDAYALGIHPLYVAGAADDALEQLAAALAESVSNPHLVAVGEIGLDYFAPELAREPLKTKQEYFCREQLKLARQYGLPVILHARRSVDQLLKALRQIEVPGGIVHAFNGSAQQARQWIDMGFKLGFGGACTYERATRLRALAETLPSDALVLETDAPDIPPHWLYRPSAERAAGVPSARNTPAELPRIGAEIARLRGVPVDTLAQVATENSKRVLSKLIV
ncbi:MAG: TatD family hydrolase [Burkholderiaceae bacterium]|nr:TatD family hydrolase [Burkholderiaceae bacterium]